MTFGKITNISLLLGIGIITSGCMGIGPKKPLDENRIISRKDIHTKPYQLNITPIIGSRQDDTKVVMDMGKIMKIWIAPYKNKGTFVSSHDNYVVAKAPDFVLGEEIPQRNWRSMKTPINKIPFQFRDADLDEAKELGSKEIVEYNNVIYQQQNNQKAAVKRMNKSNLYDEEIKRFLEE